MTKPKKPAEKAPSPFRLWADAPENAAIGELCEYLVTHGNQGHLANFAREKGFPYGTMLAWINSDPQRIDFYARAREDRADILADEIVAIADEEVTMIRADKHGTKDDDSEGNTEVVFDATAVARNKLRVDARKWAASKLKPRVYGEKLETTHKGTVGVTLQASPADEAL